MEKHEEIHIEIYSELHSGIQKYNNFDSEYPVVTSTAESLTSVYKEFLLSTGISSWKCERCSKCFLTQKQLYHHIIHIHDSQSPQECFMCGTIFPDVTSLRDHLSSAHMLTEAEVTCEICFQQFKSKSERDLHISLHPSLFKCKWCLELFPSQFHIRAHLVTHKLLVAEHECNVCGCYFLNSEIRNLHIKRHNETSCSLCPYSAQNHKQLLIENSEVLLLRHIQSTHSSDEILQFLKELQKKDDEERKMDHPFQDKILLSKEITSEEQSSIRRELHFSHGSLKNMPKMSCKFSDDDVYQRQQSEIYEFNNGYDNSQTVLNETTEFCQPMKLSDCCVQFTSKQKAQSVANPVHKTVIQSENLKISTVECPECQKELKSKDDILKHTLDHQRPFTCEVCNTKLTHWREYKKHVREHGIQEKNSFVKYKCSQCNVQCSTLSGLRKHILIHTDLKPFLCDMCGRRFRRARALSIHIQAVHKPVNLFQCSQCGTNTRSHASLLRHVLCVHEGVRRFICGLCGARCLQNQDLRRHLKLTHNAEFPPLPCINKKAGNEVHVIPAVNYLKTSDHVVALINSAVKEEKVKMVELKRISQQCPSNSECDEKVLSAGSQSVADCKQPLFLLGDVASKATPLKEIDLSADLSQHVTDSEFSKASPLNCNTYQLESLDIHSQTSYITQHEPKITSHTTNLIRAVPLPPLQTLLLCSLPTYTVHLQNPNDCITSVPKDVFSDQSTLVPSVPIDMSSSLVYHNASLNICSSEDASASIEEISHVFEPPLNVITSSGVHNIILKASGSSPNEANKFCSEEGGVGAISQEHFDLNIGLDRTVSDMNEYAIENAASSKAEINMSSSCPDKIFGSIDKEHLKTCDKVSFDSVQDRSVEVALSLEDVRKILKENLLSVCVPDATDIQMNVGAQICSASFSESPKQNGESLSWNDVHPKPFSEVLLTAAFCDEDKGSSLLNKPVEDMGCTRIEAQDAGNCGLGVRRSSENSSHSSTKLVSKNTQNLESCYTAHSGSNASSSVGALQISKKEKIFKCQECNKQLSSSYNLKRHLIVHKADKPYKCSECSKAFRFEFNLTAHYRIHTGERPYVCNVCSKSFRYTREFKDHCNKHKGRKPYECSECGLQFTRQRELSRHFQKHILPQRPRCKFCCKVFSRMDYLKMHVMKLHSKSINVSNDDKSINMEGVLEFSCTVCKEAFTCESDLTVHLKTHRESNSQIINNRPVNKKIEVSDELEDGSKTIMSVGSSLSKSDMQIPNDVYKVLDGQEIGDNLINVAYHAAEGGLQLICLRESESLTLESNAIKQNDSEIDLENIVYIELFESDGKSD